MNYHNILAAKLNLDLDYKTILNEMLSCEDNFIYTPPKDYQINDGLYNRVFMVADQQTYIDSDYVNTINKENANTHLGSVVKKSFRGSDIFYLRLHNELNSESETYVSSKRRNIDGYGWRTNLINKIPYTKEVIEKIFTKIGLIRVFVMKDTYLVTHRDYIHDVSQFYNMDYYSTEYEKVLGLSLIPSTGDVPMKIYSRLDKKVIDIPGNAMLFNDSVFHGVPITNGYRITIRIFGELDYSQFDNKIDMEHTYFLEPNNIV